MSPLAFLALSQNQDPFLIAPDNIKSSQSPANTETGGQKAFPEDKKTFAD